MSEVVEHYEQVREDERLRTRWGLLEFVRTQEIVLRHLPPAPRRVLDVGGAAGVYSEWLGSLGYETHLLDLVERHVERAKQTCRHISSAEAGDARRLPHADGSFDAVLLFGPLYHLTDRAERLAALREARRVLRPGGVVYAAAICRFAPLLHSLFQGFFDEPGFVPILDRDLADGQHRNTTGNPDRFTTAFFHRPEELRQEISEAGFSLVELAGVEGPGWLALDFEKRWADPAWRELLLAVLRRVEHEPALMGVSLHLVGVGRKG